MRSKVFATATVSAVALAMLGVVQAPESGSWTPSVGTVPVAKAAPAKSLSGSGGGNPRSTGQRLSDLASDNVVPLVIVGAGCALLGVLFTRNIGAAVGIVLVTLMSLMFLVAPQSIAGFAKGVADIIF